MKISEILRGRSNHIKNSVIYTIKNENEYIYIGKSWNPQERIREHYITEDSLGIYLKKHRPISFGWNVTFICLPDFITDIDQADLWIKNQESELIRKFKPILNVQYNPTYWAENIKNKRQKPKE